MTLKPSASFCEEMMFDPAILPQLNFEERNRYNQFQDDLFFDYVDKITSSERETFYEDYDFNIKPATDNRAYFSQYIKWRNLNRLAQFFGNRSLPFFEIGYLLVIITLVQISIASFVLILLPLFKIRWKGKSKAGIILYFGGIGLGYMFVEMVFIQRFMLYFGNPVYAGSAVITSLLIFSGLGSYHSNYFTQYKKRRLTIFIFIVLILFAILVFINTHFTAHSSCKLVLKIVYRFPDHSAPRILHGCPFPGRAISNFKDELSMDTLGLGNQRYCVCDKYCTRNCSSGRNGIYLGNVIGGVGVLPAITCTGKNGGKRRLRIRIVLSYYEFK